MKQESKANVGSQLLSGTLSVPKIWTWFPLFPSMHTTWLLLSTYLVLLPEHTAAGKGAATVFRSAHRCWTLDCLLNTQWMATLAIQMPVPSLCVFQTNPGDLDGNPDGRRPLDTPVRPTKSQSPWPGLSQSQLLDHFQFTLHCILETPTLKDIRIITHFLSRGDPQPLTTHTKDEWGCKELDILSDWTELKHFRLWRLCMISVKYCFIFVNNPFKIKYHSLLIGPANTGHGQIWPTDLSLTSFIMENL